jgi:hypothetical protein
MAINTDFGDLEQVAETAQIYEAELIAGRLRSEGLDASVVDQTFKQEPLPASRSFAVVRVLVPRAQVEEARRVLASAAALPRDEDPPGSAEVM